MDEQKTDQDAQTLTIERPRPKPPQRHARYSPPPHEDQNYVPQPHRDDRVPEHYRWHDCM